MSVNKYLLQFFSTQLIDVNTVLYNLGNVKFSVSTSINSYIEKINKFKILNFVSTKGSDIEAYLIHPSISDPKSIVFYTSEMLVYAESLATDIEESTSVLSLTYIPVILLEKYVGES